jgi:hypothetical protein
MVWCLRVIVSTVFDFRINALKVKTLISLHVQHIAVLPDRMTLYMSAGGLISILLLKDELK